MTENIYLMCITYTYIIINCLNRSYNIYLLYILFADKVPNIVLFH